MPSEANIRRLAESVAPSEGFRARVHTRIKARTASHASLQSVVAGVEPSKALRTSLKRRVLRAITPEMATRLQSLVSSTGMPAVGKSFATRLTPLRESPTVHSGLKWAAAFAVLVLVVRVMPIFLLAPTTSAEVGVMLVPYGNDVSLYVGGVWRTIDAPEVVRGPIMVSTGEGTATLILNDDGVLRLGKSTTLKLHDTADRPQVNSAGPMATLLRGELWALGLLPPIVDSLMLETSRATLSLNEGSASVTDKDGTVTVAVYDKGVTLTAGDETSFLVTGEKAVAREGRALSTTTLPTRAFTDAWVEQNLSQDAVHRSEIARLQEERRAEMAGILPTSFLYPVKRMAERVDVLFTLSQDGRTEKRLAQASTRLSEALALINEGQDTEASGPLTEYKQTLVALAADKDDNLVKYMIEKQIADASSDLAGPTDGTGASVALLKDAVAQVGAVIPNADLSPKDIEGYVLVDKLAQVTRTLTRENDPSQAARMYADVRPYLGDVLNEADGAHPLLQKEARALLVSASSLPRETPSAASDALVVAMVNDMSQYLPEEQTEILVSEEELGAQVTAMLNRIFVFRHPTSRYNQLLTEMRELQSNPNRGTLLRRLKAALPEDIGEYVNTEIQKLGDELKRQ